MFKKRNKKPLAHLTDEGAEEWRRTVLRAVKEVLSRYTTEEIDGIINEGDEIEITIGGDRVIEIAIEEN